MQGIRDRLEKGKTKRTRLYQIEHNRKKREDIKRYLWSKKSSGCSICGEKHPACIDFHHKDPGHKEENLSRSILMGKKKAMSFIDEESKKCVLLCSNCHRKLHSTTEFEIV